MCSMGCGPWGSKELDTTERLNCLHNTFICREPWRRKKEKGERRRGEEEGRGSGGALGGGGEEDER